MATIHMDGRDYEMVDPGEMNIGQARILKRYTGMTLNEIGAADSSDPDLIAAFCHLALMADNPTATFAQLEARVDAVKFASLDYGADEEEEPDDPIPPVSAPSGRSGNATVSSISGVSSSGGSDDFPATTPLDTGPPASPIGAVSGLAT